MFRKIEDNRTEVFFSPIPKWITLYSQIAIVAIFIIIAAGSLAITYPKEVKFRVVVRANGAYIVTDVRSYRKIIKAREVLIESPIDSDNFRVPLELDKMWFSGDFAYIPLNIGSSDLLALPVRDSIILTGKVVDRQSSMLAQIFGK